MNALLCHIYIIVLIASNPIKFIKHVQTLTS